MIVKNIKSGIDNQKRYYVISCHVLWREICHYASKSENFFNFRFLKQGLHNEPDLLREKVQEEIDRVEDDEIDYDAILLGYGLCSNGVRGLVSRGRPLVLPRGHDCVTLFLGSKERYREYFDSHPGAYWYTSGWIETSPMPGKERYEMARKYYIDTYGEDNGEYLMEVEQSWTKEYKHAPFVKFDFFNDEKFCAYAKRSAEWLNWTYEELEADSSLIERFLAGEWDPKDFLIINPGEKVDASYDDGIVKTV